MNSKPSPLGKSEDKSGDRSDSPVSLLAKKKSLFSIMDDVLGPRGRGPSSSHSIAPYLAAYESQALLGGPPDLAEIYLFNSFAKTGKGHRTDTAIAAGLLGLAPEDISYIRALELAEKQGVVIHFHTKIDEAEHPNIIVFRLSRGPKILEAKVKSTGGGNYEIKFDFTGGILTEMARRRPTNVHEQQADTKKAFDLINEYLKQSSPSFLGYSSLASQLGLDCPTFALMLELFVQFKKDGIQHRVEVWENMEHILETMLCAVERGLKNQQQTQVTPGDWGKKLIGFNSLFGDLWPTVAGAIAAQEYNAGMGLIAAAPTGGASGTLPGLLFGLERVLSPSRERMVQALLVAGLIGQVAFSRGPVSGSQSGCGGEIGVAAAMAAGAAAFLRGGNWAEIDAAASLSAQLFVGLECSPTQGLVEYPCIPRNGSAALLAIVSAEEAMAGMRPPFSVDQTLDRIFGIGRLLPRSLREHEDGEWMSTALKASCCGKGGCNNCPGV
ncbi:MAG: L-serine ammonia-lyase, iron-sulfur-dependent, subunit alpha [Acidobacteria bacterium]|nr:L-serine ammonia-lyase, iron-sulfur-dependent, subunit alpha [Acidobacteriota bacterium]